MLAKTVGPEETDWDAILPKVMMAYRAATHASTGQSPYRVMFGRHCRMPEDTTSHMAGYRRTAKQYIENLGRVLDQINEAVKGRLSKDVARQKRYHDLVVKPQHFKVGDSVFLSTPCVRPGCKYKFHKPWTAPYVIVDQLSPVVFRIRHIMRTGIILAVHVDRLKKCPAGIRLPQRRPTRKPTTTAFQNGLANQWMQPYGGAATYPCPTPRMVLFDPTETPLVERPAPDRNCQLSTLRPRRLTRPPARVRDYVTDG
uniref:Integrase catalytic domain-containing protein n=1 Tax=Trichuris muris TaxID=70415 RepID=A0A5S6QP01_TRIMR